MKPRKPFPPQIPVELEDKVRRKLDSGEEIRWMEQPIPRFFTAGSTAIFLFSIPWTLFAIFWICASASFISFSLDSIGPDTFFPLFGLPFVLIGLAMMSTPIFEYRKALKTIYVITDKRAIAFDSGWSTAVRSYKPDSLLEVYRKERSGGVGDVVFEKVERHGSEGRHYTVEQGFLNVPDARSVEGMIQELAESQSKTSP